MGSVCVGSGTFWSERAVADSGAYVCVIYSCHHGPGWVVAVVLWDWGFDCVGGGLF